jgi:hypothetical protein
MAPLDPVLKKNTLDGIRSLRDALRKMEKTATRAASLASAPNVDRLSLSIGFLAMRQETAKIIENYIALAGAYNGPRDAVADWQELSKAGEAIAQKMFQQYNRRFGDPFLDPFKKW